MESLIFYFICFLGVTYSGRISGKLPLYYQPIFYNLHPKQSIPPHSIQTNNIEGGPVSFIPVVKSQVPNKISSTSFEGSVTLPFLSRYHAQNSDGSYIFSYSGGPSARTESRDKFGNVQGAFNYIDPEGKVQTQQYIADSQGFKVAGTNLPIAPVLPELKTIQNQKQSRKKRDIAKPYKVPASTIPLPVAPIYSSSSNKPIVANPRDIFDSVSQVVSTNVKEPKAYDVESRSLSSVGSSQSYSSHSKTKDSGTNKKAEPRNLFYSSSTGEELYKSKAYPVLINPIKSNLPYFNARTEDGFVFYY